MTVNEMKALNAKHTAEELREMDGPGIGVYFDEKFQELRIASGWEPNEAGEIVPIDTRVQYGDKLAHEAQGTIKAPEGTLDPVEKEELGLE